MGNPTTAKGVAPKKHPISPTLREAATASTPHHPITPSPHHPITCYPLDGYFILTRIPY
ncbi:hypothetical protein [Halomicronema hongdechloris]|uniref:hypothetical protein n=1 Tax=Halomicronema hongdechloris TaxID=1209493 RepID=UPI001650FAFA|nr:hypothetical protein [Halomicronema hongdechloris]